MKTYLKEPNGVDFIIDSEPLTDEARKEISEFIKEYKDKNDKVKSKIRANKRRTTVRKEVVN